MLPLKLVFGKATSILPISSLYSEKITRSIEEVVRFIGINLNNIRYTDDTLLAPNEKDLRNMSNVANEKGRKFNTEMKSKKKKLLVILRNQTLQLKISLYKTLVQANWIKFLGSTKTEDKKTQRKTLTELLKLNKPSKNE